MRHVVCDSAGTEPRVGLERTILLRLSAVVFLCWPTFVPDVAAQESIDTMKVSIIANFWKDFAHDSAFAFAYAGLLRETPPGMEHYVYIFAAMRGHEERATLEEFLRTSGLGAESGQTIYEMMTKAEQDGTWGELMRSMALVFELFTPYSEEKQESINWAGESWYPISKAADTLAAILQRIGSISGDSNLPLSLHEDVLYLVMMLSLAETGAKNAQYFAVGFVFAEMEEEYATNRTLCQGLYYNMRRLTGLREMLYKNALNIDNQVLVAESLEACKLIDRLMNHVDSCYSTTCAEHLQ